MPTWCATSRRAIASRPSSSGSSPPPIEPVADAAHEAVDEGRGLAQAPGKLAKNAAPRRPVGAGDDEPGATEEQAGAPQVVAVADEDDPAEAARPEQAGALDGVLVGVARGRLDNDRGIRDAGGARQLAHRRRLAARPAPAARKQKERRRALAPQGDPVGDAPAQRRARRRADEGAAEDDDRVRRGIL